MRNIILKLAFDGTNYAGWQRQTDQPTIQENLEARLSQITDAPVALHGAGRTDAGVHALGMVASFETESKIPCDGLLKGLNSMLPEDIRILAVEDKDPQFHARISALGKLYVYQLLVGGICLPTERLYNHHIRHELDFEAMRPCLAQLIGEHDYSCFEAAGSRDPGYTGGRGAVRKITRAEMITGEGLPLPVRFEIGGDGFLRHMVRNIVGTVLEVGSGRMSVEDFRSVLEGKDRAAAGPTAPARGLFLQEVYY
jgi:tRNA pseudouridine38-40 synthase